MVKIDYGISLPGIFAPSKNINTSKNRKDKYE